MSPPEHSVPPSHDQEPPDALSGGGAISPGASTWPSTGPVPDQSGQPFDDSGTITPEVVPETHGRVRADAPERSGMLGRYRIERKLGAGAMGSVYLAHDTQLDRRVALKIPRFAGAEPHVVQRFQREARAAAMLRHPNICPVYDLGQIDGTHYISMAYVPGRLLSKHIRADRVVPEEQAAAVVRKLALALEHAHQQGVVHRDLKPSNIMMDDHGEPVVMDFGLARRLDSQQSRITHDGTLVGTPAYMAPEQAEGRLDAVGPATDVYALGVVLYELLTGRLPFEGTVGAIIGKILTKQPPPPSALRPGLDRRLEALCLKMLSKDVRDRPQSMRQVAEALATMFRHAPSPGTPGVPDPRGTIALEHGSGSHDSTLTRTDGRHTSARPDLGRWAGEERDDNALDMTLCWCPPGSFVMGSPHDEPERLVNEDQVRVVLTHGFWLGKYTVTQAQWQPVMGTAPWVGEALVQEGADFPVIYVSWDDTMDFCRRLTALEQEAGRLPDGWEYTLPTEAQWEYACRAGTTTPYSFGDDPARLGDYAWYGDNTAETGERYAHEAGRKRANAWGLHDMHGNVWEWCRDSYAEKLPGGCDPLVLGGDEGGDRVYRGGSWFSSVWFCRSAFRRWYAASFRFDYLGFRVARVPVLRNGDSSREASVIQ